MTYSVQIDISHEATDVEIQTFAAEHGCNATLLEEFGPAGGNPLYEFTSDEYDFLLELVDQLGGNPEWIEEV